MIIVLSGFYVKAQKEVFKNGEGSHPCYWNSAITKARNGDVVAFVEGRRENKAIMNYREFGEAGWMLSEKEVLDKHGAKIF